METSGLKQARESQHMVGAGRFISMIILWFILRMTDFRKLLLNSWFQFHEKNLLAEHPSMKKDFRAVRWKSKVQMLKEILPWFLFWVTTFTRKAGMPLYLSLNLQLSSWKEIWISVQLSTCNTWKSHLVWLFFPPKVARTREWGVLTNNSRPYMFAFGRSTPMKEFLVIPSSPNKIVTNLLGLCNWAEGWS